MALFAQSRPEPVARPDPVQFLSRGFLPENLPPIYSSKSLADLFSEKAGTYLVNSKSIGSLSTFNASKRTGQRRIFSLVHPVFVHDMGVFFEKNWSDISKIYQAAPGSFSAPEFHAVGPRYVRITPHSRLPSEKLRTLARYKFCLIADVARFFPSIYTHSIPWAMHSKSASKADTNPASARIIGNKLDLILRQAQQRQTVGIPVGPDTSRIISEIVLSAVDKIFLEKGKIKKGYTRHVDDYCVGGNSVQDCESHLRDLRAALNLFELDLNELKTKIIPTSQVFAESWPLEIEDLINRSFSDGYPGAGTSADRVSTLSSVIDRSLRAEDQGIVRYAIHKLDQARAWDKHWDILQYFLAHCAIQFPHTFDYVARVISWRKRIGKSYDRALWTDVIRSSVIQNAELGRDSEVAWALWLMKEIGIRVTGRLSDAIVEHNGYLVQSLLVHMHSKGLLTDKEVLSGLNDRVADDPVSGASWPLSLEMNLLGKFPKPETLNNGVECLVLPFKENKTLIDWDAAPNTFIDDEGNQIEEPNMAIEDTTSDYEADDEDEDNDFDDFSGVTGDSGTAF